MPDPTATTLPSGAQVATPAPAGAGGPLTAADLAAAAGQVGAGGGVPQPATLPNEILGSTPFNLQTTTDAQNNVTGGPGLWQVPTGGGRATSAHDMAQKLYALSPAEVEQLQIALYKGGYYDDSIYKQHANPSWGQADVTTQQAYYNAILDSTRHPEQSFGDRVSSAADINRARLSQLQTTGQVVDLHPSVVSLSKINLSDPATLHVVARAAAQALTGKDPTDAELTKIADNIRGQQQTQGEHTQAGERAAATTQAALDKQAAITKAAGPQANPAELSTFKQVIANEIVGPVAAFGGTGRVAASPLQAKLNEYGITADTMAKWAEEARKDGASVPSLSSPQAVEMVVDHHLELLYSQTGGDWGSVANYFLNDVDQSMKASRGGAAFTPGGASSGRGLPQGFAIAEAKRAAQGAIHGTASLGVGQQPQRDAQAANMAGTNLATADLGGQGPTTTPAGVTDLSPLVSHVLTSMGQMLGHTPGGSSVPGGPTVTGDNAPVFMGGESQTAIDPSAQAQEAIRRDHPDQVYEYQMMQNMHALDSMLAGHGG